MESKLVNTAIAAFAAVAATAQAQYDPSRVGKNYRGLVVVNTEGVSYPPVSFGLTVDPADEPTALGHITPLGQRQHFLIGSELRKRYVEEGNILAPTYKVSELRMQTPFSAKHILSMQAQMLGIYPTNTDNDLSLWQQGNAVPPIAGADFSHWQQDLQEKALPYGFNTFPIEQTGLEADVFLSMNLNNCPLFANDFSDISSYLNYNAIRNLPTTYKTLVNDKGATMYEFCEYLDWAWYTDTHLNDESNLEYIRRKDCLTYASNYVDALRVSESRTNSLVAAEFINNLIEDIGQVSGQLAWEVTKRFAHMKKRLVKEGVKADPLPTVFHTYTAYSPEHLYIFALAVLNQTELEKALSENTVLPPASTLVFEVDYSENIFAYINDQPVQVFGCYGTDLCPVTTFLDALRRKVYYPDVEAACNSV